jgi:DNA-binding transcriptional LysR family regulator
VVTGRTMTIHIFETEQNGLKQSPLETAKLFSGAYWDEMRFFLAVAKCRSFGKAAELLNVSTPTVSRKVKRLQDIVGAQLFVSTMSGTAFTDKGIQLAKALAQLDLLLSTLSNDLQSEKNDAVGTVRVAATEGLAGFFIAPNLDQIADAFPNIQVSIQTPTNIDRLQDNQTDIMIGFFPEVAHGIVSRRLGTAHLMPVMSRHYFEKYGAVTQQNLHTHRFIQTSLYSGQSALWQPWVDLVGQGKVAHLAENSFSYGMLVKSGLGIGLLGNYTLLEPIAIPLALAVHIEVPLYIVAISDRLKCRPVRIVFDMLSDIFSAKNPWFSEALRTEVEPTLYDRGFRSLFNIG